MNMVKVYKKDTYKYMKYKNILYLLKNILINIKRMLIS